MTIIESNATIKRRFCCCHSCCLSKQRQTRTSGENREASVNRETEIPILEEAFVKWLEKTDS